VLKGRIKNKVKKLKAWRIIRKRRKNQAAFLPAKVLIFMRIMDRSVKRGN